MQNTQTFEQLLVQYSKHKSYLSPAEVTSLSALFDEQEAFYQALLDWVSQYAITPISQFHVAALALESGANARLFFGANLEFNAQALSLVVHAEQSAIHNAFIHGAHGIDKLIINASPCGYCRQFLNEIKRDKQPLVSVAGVTRSVQEYLPQAFGPEDLANSEPLFSHGFTPSTHIDEYVKQSYAPYSGNRAACQISDKHGQHYFGVYLENAAYSPSLSPLQAALSQMQLHNRESGLTGISEILLKQTKGQGNQLGVAEAVAASLKQKISITAEEV